jgi:hypothetical protein
MLHLVFQALYPDARGYSYVHVSTAHPCGIEPRMPTCLPAHFLLAALTKVIGEGQQQECGRLSPAEPRNSRNPDGWPRDWNDVRREAREPLERSEGATNGFQAVPRILLCLPYFWLLVPGLPALHVSVQLHGKCQLQLPLFNSYRYAPKLSKADPRQSPSTFLTEAATISPAGLDNAGCYLIKRAIPFSAEESQQRVDCRCCRPHHA